MSIRFYQRIVKYVPNKLKYIVAIDVVAHATTGKYSKTNVPELSAMDAIKRFADDKEVEV